MFDTIFTTTSDGSISITQSVIAIGAALIIGFVIAAVYMFICKKEGYQKNFIIGLCNTDRKSTRLNSSHANESRMPSSA